MRPIDITFSPNQFKSLSQFVKPGNVLSPLIDPSKVSNPGRLTNREVVQGDGSLQPDLLEALEVLAEPSLVSNVTFVNTNQVMDAYWFARSGFASDGKVSLANQDGEIRLQAPSSLDDSLIVLQSMMGPANFKFTEIKGKLDITATWALWSLLDQLREGQNAVPLESIRKGFDAPFEGLKSLGAYFRQTLDLVAPSRAELDKAMLRLAFSGLIKASPQGYIPQDDVLKLAEDLKVIKSHVHFSVKSLTRDGNVESIRYWALQSTSGVFLLWSEVNSEVTFRTVTPMVLVTFMNHLLDLKPHPENSSVPVIPGVSNFTPASKVETIHYSPPKVKKRSSAGRVITSIVLGLVSIGVGLFSSGYLTYNPQKGIVVEPIETQSPASETEVAEVNETATAVPVDSESTTLATTVSDITVDMVNIVLVDEFHSVAMGHVMNNGPAAVMDVMIDLDIKNAEGATIQEASTSLVTLQLAAGEDSFFAYDLYELPEPASSVTATVTSVSPAIYESTIYLAKMKDLQLVGSTLGAEIIADVYNESDQQIEILSVFGFFLNEAGEIIGLASTENFNIGLRPGENIPVKVNIPISVENADKLTSFQLIAEVQYIDEIVESEISVSASQNVFRYNDRLVMAGEVMNTSNEPVIFFGLASGFYDEAGVLLDAAYTSLGLFIEPGGTIPYLLHGYTVLDYVDNQSKTVSKYLVLAPRWSSIPIDTTYLQFDVADVTTRFFPEQNHFEVVGTITNNNSLDVLYGAVIASLRDPVTGAIVSAEPTWFGEFTPGSSLPFTLYMAIPPGIDPSSLTLEVKAAGQSK